MTRQVKPRPTGPKTLRGSDEAKRKAAVILEAFAGLRTTPQAADELGIALTRYYVLETRMVQAIIDALEPQARGRKRTEAKQRADLEADNKRLGREVSRLQALYRATQRVVGVTDVSKPKRSAAAKTTKGRRKSRQSRGERVLRQLKGQLSESPAEPATIATSPEK